MATILEDQSDAVSEPRSAFDVMAERRRSYSNVTIPGAATTEPRSAFEVMANRRGNVPSWIAPEANRSLTQAIESAEPPESYAQDLKVAKETGLPIDVVSGNRDEILKRKRISDIDTEDLAKTHPRTAEYLANAENAKLSYEDIESFKKLEDTLRVRRQEDSVVGEMLSRFGSSAAINSLAVLETPWRLPRAAAEAFDFIPNLIAQGLEAAGVPKKYTRSDGAGLNIFRYIDEGIEVLGGKASGTGALADELARIRREEAPQIFDPEGKLEKDAQRVQQAQDALLKGDFTPLLDVVTDPALMAGMLGSATPSLAVAMLSGGSLAATSILIGGEQVSNIAEFEQKTGMKISNTDFIAATMFATAIGGWLERAGLNTILKPLGKSKTFDVARATVTELGTETGQTLAGNIAAAGTYDPAQDVTEGLLQSALAGGVSGAAFGVPASLGAKQETLFKEHMKERNRRLRSSAEQTELDQVITYAQESKTVQLSPEHSDRFLDLLDTDTEVFIDKSVFDADIELPDFIESQLGDVVNTDVVLNLKQVANIAMDKELLNLLRPHMRMGVDGMSQDEMKSGGVNADVIERLMQEAVQAETDETLENIEKDIREQLLNTGRMNRKEALLAAKIIPRSLQAKVGQYGDRVLDIFKSVGLKIEGPESPTVPTPSIPLKQDFKGVRLSQGEVVIKETGQKAKVFKDAQKTWDTTVKRRNVVEALLPCLTQ